MEDTQDLAGPVKAVSQSIPLDSVADFDSIVLAQRPSPISNET